MYLMPTYLIFKEGVVTVQEDEDGDYAIKHPEASKYDYLEGSELQYFTQVTIPNTQESDILERLEKLEKLALENKRMLRRILNILN